MEVKGHERDLQIQLLTVENRDLTKNNKVLTERVTMLQEDLLEAKVEWQGLKDAGQIREDSAVEIREVMNSKTPKVEGKTGEQAYIHGVKEKDKYKRDCTKKLGYKSLAILLIWKKKHTARGTTCKVEKTRKDKVGKQT